MGPTGNARVAQIHPSRRCNLRCLHCYSSSSPEESESLDYPLLRTTLDDLAREGYNWISLSGGEPLVYPELPRLLAHAKKSGLSTGVVTNGTVLTEKRLDAVQDVTDILVISLDGKPQSHNTMRDSEKAFETMAKRLPDLRARGVCFGFLFTLTQHNLDELPWVAQFAASVGAQLLQVHPLEHFGNARLQLSGKTPDSVEGGHAWLLSQKLQQALDGCLPIQVDLTHTQALRQQPERFFVGDDSGSDRDLADLLSPLIIESNGEVVPLRYGFPRAFSLGNLYDQRLSNMADAWRHDHRAFTALCRGLQSDIARSPQDYYFNWYEEIAAYAEAAPAGPRPVVPVPLPMPNDRPAV